jgi:thymidylate synthase (FAD)
MVDIVIELETTRDIAHQIVRHRSFSFSEFSQRYADPTASLGFEYSEARLQDAKNRQSSIETDDEDLAKSWLAKQQQIAHESELAYKWAVSKGIAKELARKVLPEGLTTTRLYMKGSLRSWIHYLEVRIDPTTQKEHRRVAEEVECLLLEKFPFLEEYWYPPVLDEPYYEDDAQPKQSWYNRVLAWFGL